MSRIGAEDPDNDVDHAARKLVQRAKAAVDKHLRDLQRQVDEGENLHRSELEAMVRNNEPGAVEKLREFEAAMIEVRAKLDTIEREARDELASIVRDGTGQP